MPGSRGGGWWPGEDPEGRPREEEADRENGEQEPERRPPRGLASADAPKPGARYSRFVGLAFLALIVLATINLLQQEDPGIIGADDAGRGQPLAEFAVPDALGELGGDANVAQDDCETSRNPCPVEQQRDPACEIDAEGALRVCDFFDLPLAISFWFTRGGDCLPTQDAFDAVAPRYEGRANFLSVNVRDERDTVLAAIEDGGWDVPVGLDADGAVSNIYRVGVCPTIVLAYPGGILHEAAIRGGNYSEAEVTEMVDGLLAASRERAARSR